MYLFAHINWLYIWIHKFLCNTKHRDLRNGVPQVGVREWCWKFLKSQYWVMEGINSHQFGYQFILICHSRKKVKEPQSEKQKLVESIQLPSQTWIRLESVTFETEHYLSKKLLISTFTSHVLWEESRTNDSHDLWWKLAC